MHATDKNECAGTSMHAVRVDITITDAHKFQTSHDATLQYQARCNNVIIMIDYAMWLHCQ